MAGHKSNSSTFEDTNKSIIPTFEVEPISTLPPPLVSSYNYRIRPLLDAVDKLRNLKVMKEGIQLPTIVVVGDQSSGKSSVLESLAGISLPRGQGVCTRVPLIMRLQHHSDLEPVLSLEYSGKVVQTDEENVSQFIDYATKEIAGNAKGISNTPITLVVKKKGVPDLTMVDLPGITRVPVHGQPEHIYEQIRDMIMDYITPEESIILNVLSATVDFSTCESIMMSQSVDKTGKRTLAVVTKADKAPEGLLEKVTNDDVSIGLGYVCVRNRIGDESYEEARFEEARLFQTHSLLSKIDESIVGVPVLGNKLVQIQARIISECLPNIVKQINAKLEVSVNELDKLPHQLSNVADATVAFVQMLGLAKESLTKIVIRGEFEDYHTDNDEDDNQMHCTARLAQMLDNYSKELHETSAKYNAVANKSFLMEEVQVLNEARGIGLPNFLPRNAFMIVLKRRIDDISSIPVEFVNKVWVYIEYVVNRVLTNHADNYPQILPPTKRAANNLINRMKNESVKRVKELVEMEKIADYTSNPEYMTVWTTLMLNQEKFMKFVEDELQNPEMEIEGFGKLQLGHMRNYKSLAQEAFDMKMRFTAYWSIVLRRLVDSIALHLLFSIRRLVEKELQGEIVSELMGYGGGIERMLDEAPSTAGKRFRLQNSIRLLKESKDVVAKIIDRICIDE